jgi:hypothetical protein
MHRAVHTTTAVAVLVAGIGAAAPAAAATDNTAPRVASASIGGGARHALGANSGVVAVMPAVGFGNKITITVRATDNVGVEGVAVALLRNGRIVVKNDQEMLWWIPRTSGTARDGVWKTWVRHERVDPQDVYTVRVIAVDKAENLSDSKVAGRYVTRYKTRVVKFDAGPEPAPAGGVVTLTGRVGHVTRSKGWQPYQGSPLAVQFRAAGTSKWVIKGWIWQTREDGTFDTGKRFHAKQAGTWRVVFGGDMRHHTSVSGGDLVNTA